MGAVAEVQMGRVRGGRGVDRWVVAAWILMAACQRTGTPSANGPAAQAALPAELSGMKLPPAPEETRPVYPIKLAGDPDPRAVTFCRALHAVPASRRQACCHDTPGAVLTDECVRTVTYAARDGAVAFDDAALAACGRDVDASLAGCDWVGLLLPDLPASCRGVLRGTLAAGARCRSSLECQGTLRCQGAGPVTFGKCAPARSVGQGCALAVDALAAYTRQDRVDAEHPECLGYCGLRHTCEPLLATGGTCVMNSQCGPGHHCAAGRCADGAIAQKGEACTADECVAGTRCTGGRCQVPRAAGEACVNDFECLGGCQKPPTATGNDRFTAPGICAPKCVAQVG